MIISKGKRFIFIHIYRTAGSSMREALDPFSNKNFLQQKLQNLAHKLGFELNSNDSLFMHSTALDIRNYLGTDRYDGYYSFAFCRNPYDWLASQYNYIPGNKYHHNYKNYVALKSIDHYVQYFCQYELQTQTDFVVDENGEEIVNYIGRFENLKGDFEKVCKQLSLDVSLPHKNPSERPVEDPRNLMSEETIQLIQEKFHDDFERFGYPK